MTNLEWIRTLSAKELSDLLYDYWLPRGQYVWTDSRKGLIKVLSENYIERDCDKCKHQGNCYCVKGLGCPFEPKDEPTISKMEQVDEPQYEMGMGTLKCDNCSEYGSFKCTKCDGEMYFKRLEPKDEPETETSTNSEKVQLKVQLTDEPQTDCAWMKGEE